MISGDLQWWRHAVVYQVYIRSFADGNGDGVGDIAGLRSRLPYLADLGVDAIWINPWYPSPQADAGYDVVTYQDIEPSFGTLAEAETLIDEAHTHGIRVILDIVPNHSSSLHPWFQQALAAAPGSPARDRFMFSEGRGEHGELPPNDWPSCFGGPAWTRTTDPDGTPGQWYLHLFAPEQPDRNWEHPDTHAEYADALRFWFDRGVDGFRVDVAMSLFKQPGLPDLGDIQHVADEVRDHPFWDIDRVHDVYRAWRSIADSYDPPRVFVAEAWVPKPERLARYVRPDELHTTFNFDFLQAPWQAAWLRGVIDRTIAEHAVVGAPPTWVLSNHDVVRHVSRYGRAAQDHAAWYLKHLATEVDLELGRRRARAALLLMLALPGGCYLYQGEELGLPEVEDIAPEALRDPTWVRSDFTDPGRDGCRVPIPWAGTTVPFGFSTAPDAAAPWLPQPAWFESFTAASQADEPTSMLTFYRSALEGRRRLVRANEQLEWQSSESSVLSFTRGTTFMCMVNLGDEPAALPAGWTVAVASHHDTSDQLPGDAAVWLRCQ